MIPVVMESVPNPDLAWLLYVIMGVLVLAVFVGALTTSRREVRAARRVSQPAGSSRKNRLRKNKPDK